MPATIATFLIFLSQNYVLTRHCFRQTSATLLANTGMDVIGLKKHGGWKSGTISESYVADSIYQILETAKKNLNALSVKFTSDLSVQIENTTRSCDNEAPRHVISILCVILRSTQLGKSYLQRVC